MLPLRERPYRSVHDTYPDEGGARAAREAVRVHRARAALALRVRSCVNTVLVTSETSSARAHALPRAGGEGGRAG